MKRTQTWNEQLRILESLPHKVDGGETLSDDFDSVTFFRTGDNLDDIHVVFEDYILNPPPQFDLHQRWNNGVAPPAKSMYGRVVSETNGMYHFVVHTDYSSDVWDGWCPKKSCIVESIR